MSNADIFNGIEEGSVVRIKFKNITDLKKKMMEDEAEFNKNNNISNNVPFNISSTVEAISMWDIGENIIALTLGGDFVVTHINEVTDNNGKRIDSITIDNHHDKDCWTIKPDIVESLEIVDVANKFVSAEHGIIMIQVEDKIYINGELLDNHDADGWRSDSERKQLDKFKQFMENYVAAQAFQDAFGEDDTDE